MRKRSATEARGRDGAGPALPPAATDPLEIQMNEVLDMVQGCSEGMTAAAKAEISSLQLLLSKLECQTLTAAHDAPPFAAFNVGQPLQMQFAPPEHITMSHSSMLQVVLKQQALHVHLLLHLPRGCVLAKDFRDHRYHAKRLLYLSHVASAIENRSHSFRPCTWACPHGDVRRPVLVYSPAGNSAVVVHVGCSVPSGLFNPSKLAPHCTCLRTADSAAETTRRGVGGDEAGGAGGKASQAGRRPSQASAKAAAAPGTAVYNASVLADAVGHEHWRRLADSLQTERLRGAACLLWRWVCQQMVESAFIEPLVHALWVLLAREAGSGGAVATSTSAFQAFRATLAVLESCGACRLTPDATAAGPATSQQMRAHSAHCDCVCLDFTGTWNILAPVPAAVWSELQRRAGQSLVAAFTGPQAAAGVNVPGLFLGPRGCAAPYDLLLLCSLSTWGSGAGVSAAELPLRCDAPAAVIAAKKARSVLVRALGERATHVAVVPAAVAPVQCRCASSLPGVDGGAARLVVGVNLEGHKAQDAVDRGPAADSGKAAAGFRALWGERAEMRRFPDGTICEAVTWMHVSPNQRHTIPELIVKHILSVHLPGVEVVHTSTQWFDPVLALEDEVDVAGPRFQEIDRALELLSRALQRLEHGAFKVTLCRRFGALAAHTACFPPAAHPLLGGSGSARAKSLPRCVAAAHLLVNVEIPGKWPEDETALQKLRGVVGCEIADALKAQCDMDAQVTESFLDVRVLGLVVRLHVWGNRDAALLERSSAEKLLQSGAALSQAAAPAAVVAFYQDAKQRHFGLVSGVLGAHPSAGTACRLAKRWVAAQMLSHSLPDEAVELMVLSVYSGHQMMDTPASAVCAFQRFLQLLATHSWEAQPLIVDPAGSLDSAQKAAMLQAYRTQQASRSAPECCIFTPYDSCGGVWTSAAPDRLTMQRAQTIAATCLRRLRTLISQEDISDTTLVWPRVFHCDLAAFDVLLLLRADANPASSWALPRSALDAFAAARQDSGANLLSDVLGVEAFPAPCARAVLSHLPRKVAKLANKRDLSEGVMVQFDPVETLLRDLIRTFGHCALFHYDALGGDVIGVKWKPQAFLPAAFRADASRVCACNAAETRPPAFLPDVFGILEDVVRMGEGLVADALLSC